MSKKNKDIEVRVEDELRVVNNEKVEVSKLFIGKKSIGEVIPEGEKKFAVVIDGKTESVVKTLDEGFEHLIRRWNLRE